MSKDQKRLGRGIASVITADMSQIESHLSMAAPSPGFAPGAAGQVRIATIPVEHIRPNPRQPRRQFDESSLSRLADSLLRRGALQPIVVRPADAGYELVAGERRWRAAKLAGIHTIPAIVRAVNDDELLELALIENLHREDLNPVERAHAYRALHVEHGLSHEQIGERMGDDRATITNYIRLLDLHPEVLQLVSAGALSMGHARATLGIKDQKNQISFVKRVLSQNWSVRRTEAEVGRLRSAASPASEGHRQKMRPAVADMVQRLTAAVGARVSIREGRKRHSGRITIEYYSLDDFDRICAMLGAGDETP